MTAQDPAATNFSETIAYSTIGNVGVITIDNPPVNAGSASVRAGMLAAIEHLANDSGTMAGIIHCAGRTFVAGSDLKEFGKPLQEPQWPVVFAAIEACPKPVIAAIHGAALGGGYELALACDWRVATPDASVGLPETRLGMIPGAGGTQRLPRLTGINAAIDVIASGRHVKSPEALALQMIDAIAEGELLQFAVTFAQSEGQQKRPAASLNVPAETPEQIEQAASTALKKNKNRANIVLAIETIKLALTTPFDDALQQERAAFQTLRTSEEAAALRYNFFAERAAAKFGDIDGTPQKLDLIGVIGGGTMGAGIATMLCASGYRTLLVDTDAKAIERARTQIDKALTDLEKFGKLGLALSAARGNLELSQDFNAIAPADLVIEAVFEDMAVKTDVMTRLGATMRPGAIIASNTSYLDINALAATSGRPAQFLGLHFFAPVPRMRLLEVVRCAQTDPDTLRTGLALGKAIGKLPILAGPCEGFIGNRIYAQYRAQCEYMLEEGALPEQVDRAIEKLGFSMGPFAVADLSGLDIAWRNRQRKAATRDPRTRYVTIPDMICELGRLGRKTGAGWYTYGDTAPGGTPDPIVTDIVRQAASEHGATGELDEKTIQHRALGAIVNEAALLLEDGMARSAAEIDLVLVNGYGFSKFLGGPLFLASRLPAAEIKAMIDAVETATGFGFRRGDVAAMLKTIG